MLRRSTRIPLLILAAVFALTALAGTAHATANSFTYSGSGSYKAISQRFRVDAAGPRTYFAHQFALQRRAGAHPESGVGYFGLQPTAIRPDGTEGPMAIFSIWQAKAFKLGSAGSRCVPFDHEGSGISCSIAYNWRPGFAYDFKMERVAVTSEGMWWRTSIVDAASGRETVIATIRAPKLVGPLTGGLNFLEHYGERPASCSRYRHSKVTFLHTRAFDLNDDRWVGTHGFNGNPQDLCQRGRFSEVESGWVLELGNVSPTNGPRIQPGFRGVAVACDPSQTTRTLYTDKLAASPFGLVPTSGQPLGTGIISQNWLDAPKNSIFAWVWLGSPSRAYAVRRDDLCEY